MITDRDVGGIRCRHVLELLPDYMAGELPQEHAAQVETHVHGCDWCARFGGEYASAVAALRTQLLEPEPLSRASRTALRVRLGSEGLFD
jgi:anti-sigma factor RsiW